MEVNYVGIIACLIVVSSLAFPWWTLQMSIPIGSSEPTEESISVYSWQVSTETVILNFPDDVWMNLWFGWATFALMVVAGVVGIIGSLKTGKIGKVILLTSGILTIVSIVFFTVGIQNELAIASPIMGFPVDLFTTSSSLGITSYYYYFDMDFWVALIGTVVTLVSIFGYRIQKLFQKPEQ